MSNENIVYESLIHNHVYNEFDVNNNPIPDANLNDYYHYHWFDNYKYPTDLYTADDLAGVMYHIRNKDWKGVLPAADDVKYDFPKMNNYSNTDTYLTVGDISYGIASQPNVLVENVNDNSWNYDLSTSMWEPDIWEPTGKTPSIINWMDISLGHKPLRWGPADRKEHLANKDENLEILQLILDINSTGTIELSYGNDLDNQIYYQKLYVNEGEISMNLVRTIPPGMIIDTLLRKIYLKGPVAIASTKDKVSMVDMTITWSNYTIDFNTFIATMDADDSPHHNQLNDANAELGPLTVFDNLMPANNIVIGDWVTSSKFNYNENDPNGNTDFEEIFTRLQSVSYTHLRAHET